MAKPFMPWWHIPAQRFLLQIDRYVGDCMILQGLVEVLRQHRQASFICILAPEPAAGLARELHGVDEVIVLPYRVGQIAYHARANLVTCLKTKQIDVAITTTARWKYALPAFLAGIPHRVGWIGRKWREKKIRSVLLNDRRDSRQEPVAIYDRMAMLGMPPGFPAPFYYPRLALDLTKKKLANTKVLALCLGSGSGPSKQWPLAYWCELAKLAQQNHWNVAIFGTAADADWSDVIINSLDRTAVINYAGKYNLQQNIRHLAETDMVLSNDSGLMHIAAAMDKALVVMYGPTPPSIAMPLCRYYRIFYQSLVCSPCYQATCPLKHHHCLNTITSKEVWSGIDQLWKEVQTGSNKAFAGDH